MIGQALIALLVYLPVIGFVVLIGGLATKFFGLTGWWLAICGLVLIVIGVLFWLFMIKNLDFG